MGIDKQNMTVTMKGLVKKHGEGKLDFALEIQRNEVWEPERKSLFIQSIMMGYPFPPAYAWDQGDGINRVVDGKQRMTTVIGFINNEWALHKSTPAVGETVVAEKYFRDLPEDLQDTVTSEPFLVYVLKNCTIDDIREVFRRQNNGKPLTTIELTRSLATGNIAPFVNEIANMPFFSERIKLSDKNYNRFIDQELIYQILYTLAFPGDETLNYSGRSLRTFVENTVRNEGFDTATMDQVRVITEYLGNALPEQQATLRKVHVPMVFMMAKKAVEKGIPAKQFGGWVQGFLARIKVKEGAAQHIRTYQSHTGAGSASAKAVQARLKAIEEDFNKCIDDAPDYKVIAVHEPSSNPAV